MVIDSYRNSFFNFEKYNQHQKGIAVARAGNVIGGGDWSKDRLLPDIARALSNNKVIIIRNPNSIRPWQHVIEPLIGYLQLGMKLKDNPKQYSQPYNFGPNTFDALSVMEMVDKSIKCWGSGKCIIDDKSSNPHEAGLLKLDISKTTNELCWNPLFNASKAVELTINWYKKYYQGIKAGILIQSDIEYFQSLINE